MRDALTRSRARWSNARVIVRRAATWISTVLVAIVVAFTVPVSQLRTVAVITTCCCPDPDNCHCPDHRTEHGSQPTMQQCHKSADSFESVTAPTVAIVARVELVPVRAAIALHHALPAPHASPILERPRGPS
jgi:hypothetical protein